MDVLLAGDALAGEPRREFIERGLRALRDDPRFSAG
jgi:hypothetical protein